MSKEKYTELMDEFGDANDMLEICSAYPLADVTNLSALSTVLVMLVSKYEDIRKILMNEEEWGN